ncbi:hypothetical protein SOV_02090 [Sporomusa ovata DSM 2662]|uniref:Uncharacterized protein n=1 Tax=Sporomusa ovata TaxID=2378 RepID=A0A0U1L1P5_9FIRM|nr:hypothetical protein [Sporomusa ovata]EQB27890.1 hypothetical protein SOV_2c08010 [Sporomusa ovata DSM 2662]CQR72824.1 hypothetical protein SpAn4DRAFT_3284 [Sporomusa ovata]
MAAQVILFPAKSEPNLTEIEKLIREWLFNVSEDQDFIETVASRMISFINNYTNKWFEPTFNLVVPSTLTLEERKGLWVSIEAGVDETAKEVQEMINKIIVERFFLEIEIYESKEKGKMGKKELLCPKW